jgi:hypothetical protein
MHEEGGGRNILIFSEGTGRPEPYTDWDCAELTQRGWDRLVSFLPYLKKEVDLKHGRAAPDWPPRDDKRRSWDEGTVACLDEALQNVVQRKIVGE